ncbi:sulfotransferase family protein [Lysobacter sp. HA18]
MRLPRPWMPLPFPAPVSTLLDAVRCIDRSAWHAVDGVGERAAIALVGPGAANVAPDDAFTQWLAAFDVAWAEARVLRFEAGAHTPLQTDAQRAARDRMQVLVPLTPGWALDVDGGRIPLQPRQVGAIDTWRPHRLANLGNDRGFALVADACGMPEPYASRNGGEFPSLRLGRKERMPDPWEIESTIGALLADVVSPGVDRIQPVLSRFVRAWRGDWAATVDTAARNRALIDDARVGLQRAGADTVRLRNGLGFVTVLEHQVFAWLDGSADASSRDRLAALETRDPQFDRPVFIVSPPRAGSTLLFETLARARGVVTIGDESHSLIEGIESLTPAAHDFESNILRAGDAIPAVSAALRTRFMDQLRDRDGHRVDGMSPVRMLEKTPKNALRIPFLRAVFPEARFVYLHRDPRQVIASMLESWESGRFRTYPSLPGWDGPPWSLLLVPGWRELSGRPLADIVGHQWEATTRVLLDDLAALEPDRVLGVDYAALLDDPDAELRRICDWAGFEWDRPLTGDLPLSRYTTTKPDASKWRRREAEVAAQLATRGELAKRAAAAAGRSLAE